MCDHVQHHGLDECPGLTEAEIAFGEKVRSVALNFVGSNGKDQWHGETIKEYVDRSFENAAKNGDTLQYCGPESRRGHSKALKANNL